MRSSLHISNEKVSGFLHKLEGVIFPSTNPPQISDFNMGFAGTWKSLLTIEISMSLQPLTTTPEE